LTLLEEAEGAVLGTVTRREGCLISAFMGGLISMVRTGPRGRPRFWAKRAVVDDIWGWFWVVGVVWWRVVWGVGDWIVNPRVVDVVARSNVRAKFDLRVIVVYFYYFVFVS